MNTVGQRLVSLVIVLLQVTVALAQQHNFTNYTIEDGLPTNYVYGVVEDHRGYIWAYTEQGIARFDGYEWEAFGLSDGVGTLDCYSMCPLSDGSFLVGGKGRPSIVREDSIFELPLPKKVNFEESYFETALIKEGYPPQIGYFYYDDKTIRKSLLVHALDSFTSYEFNIPGDLFETVTARVFESDRHRVSIEKELNFLKEGVLDNLFFVGEVGDIDFVFWKSPYYYYRNGSLVGEAERKAYLSCRAGVYDQHLQLFTDSVFYQFDSLVQGVEEEVDLSYWCRRYDVNRVFRSKNGDLWIATRSKGVFHIAANNRRIKIVSDKSSQAPSIEGVVSVGDTVYVADDRSNLYRLKGDKLSSIGIERIVPNSSRFKFLRKSAEGEILFGRGTKIVKMSQERFRVVDPYMGNSEEDLIHFYMNEFKFTKEEVSKILIFKSLCDFLEYDDFVFIEDVHYHFSRDRSGRWMGGRSPHELIYEKEPTENRGYIYVGNGSDLLRWSSSNVDTLWSSDSLEISALYELGNQSVLIGTKSHGVFRLNLGEEVQVDRLFFSKYVTALNSNKFGQYWATTYSGIYRFNDRGVIDLHLTHDNGLPSDETYDLDFYADSVAIGTGNGLAIFAQNITHSNALQIPNRFVHVNGVKVEGKEVSCSNSQLVLKPGEDDIEIEFSLLHPGSCGEIDYEIELQPYSPEAVSQKSRSTRYSQLAPGDYTFFVTATASDGSKYSLEYPLEITVESYFYKQAWFQFISLILLVGGGWLYYRSRLKNRYREASERVSNERRISELQLEALRSQMNPHFVFNALGSIQYYIQSEEKDLADVYLTKFAQLMRKYLDSSKKNLVTVGEEVELLTQYLELEKMRFDHGFTFKFNIGNQVDDSDQLPSMILQPFVENAIIHGIANRNSPGGEIIVSISIESGETIVVISDNGIGIENSNKLKRRGHRSRATEITNERIAALQDSGNAKIEFSYEVPFPEQTENPGTKAILRINYHQDED